MIVEGDGVRLRRAAPADVVFLADLLSHEEIEPFLSALRAREHGALLAEIERSLATPREFGRFIVEVEDAREWRAAGVMGYEEANRPSRIALLGGLAIHPDFRGGPVADEAARLLQRYLLFELDYHRLELECYGFNTRGIDHAERAGFVREGVRRRAYWRHGDWADGVLFGLTREDLEEQS